VGVPSTGRLSLVGQWGSGNGGIASITSPKSAAVSPDERHLYVATFDGVLLFERNAATSALTYVKKYVDSPAEDGLTFGLKILVSPDGGCVYLTGCDESIGTISWFARNPVSGEIQYAGQFSEKGQSVIESPKGLTVSSDSRHLFVCAYFSNTLIWFRRDAATCSAIGNDIASTEIIGNGTNSVALSPDDAHVYVAGFGGVMVFGYDTNYIAEVSSPRVPGRLSSPPPTITWLNAGYLFVRASLPSSAAGKDCIIRLSSLDGRTHNEYRASIGASGILRAKIASPYPRAGKAMIVCTIKAGGNSWTSKCVRLNRAKIGR
jgi:DNA-binding beta-propeller fold protein YncE